MTFDLCRLLTRTSPSANLSAPTVALVTGPDERILDFVLDHRTPWLDTVMRAATSLGSFTVLTTVCVAFAVVWRRRVGDWTAALVLAVVSLLAWSSCNSLKLVIGRARPELADRLVRAGGYSFPSGHATQSAAIWGTLALLVASQLPRHRRVVWATGTAVAVAVGASRIYLGVHWFTDVIAGWTLGATFVGVTAVALTQRRANGKPKVKFGEITLKH